MNILIVHNYYKIPGGEDSVVQNEMNLLKEHGHCVRLYKRNNEQIDTMNFIEKALLPINTFFSIKTYLDIKKIIKKYRIDLIHVHNTFPLISLSVYYAARSSKKALVQSIHNFRFLCPGAVFVKKGMICEECLENGLKCAVQNRCYRDSFIQTFISAVSLKLHYMLKTFQRVDCYIALTEFNKDKFSKLGIVNNIYVKPNFVKEKFTIDADSELKKEDYYLFVGRIEALKGTHILLEAFSRLPNIPLYIVGNGDKENETREYIKKHKLKNINLLGRLPHNKTLEYMKYARACILPSQCYEGFPMVIVESFSVGTPVIVGDVGNNGILIEDGFNGYKFLYNDSNDLVNLIMKLEEDSNMLSKLKKSILEEYESKYCAKVNYKQLIDIYHIALKKAHERSL